MTAAEARQLSFEHSKRMTHIYNRIKDSAKVGNNEVYLNTGDASKEEIGVLKNNGYTASYETSETDGGQFVVIKW